MGRGAQVPLLLVDGHNLLWEATFGFPAPIYSRDKARLLTGLFAFFAPLRVAIRDDVSGAAPEVIVVFDGQYGAVGRQQVHDGYKARRPTNDQALAPLLFLPGSIPAARPAPLLPPASLSKISHPVTLPTPVEAVLVRVHAR